MVTPWSASDSPRHPPRVPGPRMPVAASRAGQEAGWAVAGRGLWPLALSLAAVLPPRRRGSLPQRKKKKPRIFVKTKNLFLPAGGGGKATRVIFPRVASPSLRVALARTTPQRITQLYLCCGRCGIFVVISASRLPVAASRSCTHNAPEDNAVIPLLRSVRYFVVFYHGPRQGS
jgi:hypothetical protein